MLYSVLSGVAAFLVCAVLLRIFIPILRRVKLGQKILEIGPSWHKSKEGTPIMGGLFFSIAITAAAVAFSLLSGSLPLRTLLVLGFALLCGLIFDRNNIAVYVGFNACVCQTPFQDRVIVINNPLCLQVCTHVLHRK